MLLLCGLLTYSFAYFHRSLWHGVVFLCCLIVVFGLGHISLLIHCVIQKERHDPMPINCGTMIGCLCWNKKDGFPLIKK